MREAFQKWLADGNVKKYPPEVLVSCVDRVSEYAARKKISAGSLWEYEHPGTFSPVYNRLLNEKLLRVTDRKTRKLFIIAGQLYLRFLKVKPFIGHETTVAVATGQKEKSASKPVHTTVSTINPEDVIAWLTTQPNANGTLYLENVVRQYMGVLRTAPAKLYIPVTQDVGDVFACQSSDDLTAYWNIYKAAPNYNLVNHATSCMFSAGMSCLLRYLQSQSKSASDSEKIDKPDVIQLLETFRLKYVDKRNSGGALWVIGGRELTTIMMKFRDSGFHFFLKEGGGRSSVAVNRSGHKKCFYLDSFFKSRQERYFSPSTFFKSRHNKHSSLSFFFKSRHAF